MEVVHARCAGLDISKTDAKVSVRIAGRGRRKPSTTVTTWSATSSMILRLTDWVGVIRGVVGMGSRRLIKVVSVVLFGFG